MRTIKDGPTTSQIRHVNMTDRQVSHEIVSEIDVTENVLLDVDLGSV